MLRTILLGQPLSSTHVCKLFSPYSLCYYMRHHREFLDMNQTFLSAGLMQMMELTGINSYAELLWNDGEDSCQFGIDSVGNTHAN